MKFYKENNINPAASCLPLVAQFPVFIALYLTLKHYSHHIHGPWLYIVPNISDKVTAHWSGFVLLAIYAGSQIASTYFMGTTMDKTQRRIMMILPLVFITVVARFPVGLLIYWMTTNLWTVGQGLVTRRLVPKPGAQPPPAATNRSSRTPPKNPSPTSSTAVPTKAKSQSPNRRARAASSGRAARTVRELSVESTGGDCRRGEVEGTARAAAALTELDRERCVTRSSRRESAGCSAWATRRHG